MLPFKNEGKIKTFSNKQKLREFAASRPTLQEILKEVLQVESKWPQTVIWLHTKSIGKGLLGVMADFSICAKESTWVLISYCVRKEESAQRMMETY